MEVTAIKDLMEQFDRSSLREFSYKNTTDELVFSKNEQTVVQTVSEANISVPVVSESATMAVAETDREADLELTVPSQDVAEGDEVTSPLVGVAYLSPAPDKPAFVAVGDRVKKGQTLMIIEAMKVMNEIPAPQDGVVTAIFVDNEEVVEFGQGLVRLK